MEKSAMTRFWQKFVSAIGNDCYDCPHMEQSLDCKCSPAPGAKWEKEENDPYSEGWREYILENENEKLTLYGTDLDIDSGTGVAQVSNPYNTREYIIPNFRNYGLISIKPVKNKDKPRYHFPEEN